MIIVIFGLPGTGKSFFARRLARKTGAAYLNTDIVRHELGKEGEYDDETKKQIYELLGEKMDAALSGNRKVIVDGTFHKNERRKQFEQRAADLHQDIYFIEMKAGEETVRNRLKSGRQYSEADHTVYTKIKNTYEPMEESHLILWSDKQSLNDMLRKTKDMIDG